ncbi:ATP-dependent RNA helicase DBP5-like [Gastrolobium bilobum]|uniref:ATP-dependent RNA helicase DBP5-like n=1 Tax=Gastrolobium bilobum TaxID=150636 RepID=UPI002AB22DC5|nr:ATP-dependent RNA helicase DBP5-like [Gastrolobium bilobum]
MAQVVIGTPGTINKWMTFKKLGVTSLKILVFDEADQMLAEDGFKDDSLRIMKRIEKFNSNCQVLLFSATFNDIVKNFVSRTVKQDYNTLFVKELSLDVVKQYKVHYPDELSKIEMKKDYILEIGENLGQTIIFVRTRNSAKMLHKSLVVAPVVAPVAPSKGVDKGKRKMVNIVKRKVRSAADIPAEELARRTGGPVIKDVQENAQSLAVNPSAPEVIPPKPTASGKKRVASEDLSSPKGAKTVRVEPTESVQSGGSLSFAMESFSDAPGGDDMMVVNTPDRAGVPVMATVEGTSTSAAVSLVQILKLSERDLNSSFPNPDLNVLVPQQINRQDIIDCVQVMIGQIMGAREATLAVDSRCSTQHDDLVQKERKIESLTAEIGRLSLRKHRG